MTRRTAPRIDKTLAGLLSTYAAQFVVDDTPAAPAEGTSQTYFVTAAVSWPADLVWSTDPDGGVAPTITGAALVSLFTYGGTTRAVLGATFPALPAEAVPPTAGTLGVVMGVTTADLTVTGATDETALAAEPYAFTMDAGVTWTAYQAGATYQYASLDPSTAYTFQHRVIDAAGNVSTGVAVTDSTAADVTGPTAGTLAVVTTSNTADLTVSDASDDVALHATPYAYSSDGGTTYTAWQAGATYEFTGLSPNTSYDFRHKVRDAAANETEGAIATTSTGATPSDTTAPTAGTLAGSAETSDGFTLTVTGATDETALDATPYAFSTDNGSTYSAWQASNVYAASGLTAETGYQCVHKVRDAALNVSTGTAITVTTAAASSVVAADTFTRADSSTLGTTEVGGYGWTATIGSGPIISSGAMTTNTSNLASVITIGAIYDYSVAFDFTKKVHTPSILCYLSRVDVNNLLTLTIAPGSVQTTLTLSQRIAGTTTDIWSGTTGVIAIDGTRRYRAEVVGTAVDLYEDDVSVATAQTASATVLPTVGTRSIGFLFYGNGTHLVDNFEVVAL